MKTLAVTWMIIAALLVGVSVTAPAKAITVEQAQTEISDLSQIVDDLTSDDFKKQWGDQKIIKFKNKLDKRIDKILAKLDNGNLNVAMRMIKNVIHALDKNLDDAAMNDVESALPETMAAAPLKH
jgi:uncharacterized protein (DUF2267 family)